MATEFCSLGHQDFESTDSEKRVQNVAPSGGEYFNKMVTSRTKRVV